MYKHDYGIAQMLVAATNDIMTQRQMIDSLEAKLLRITLISFPSDIIEPGHFPFSLDWAVDTATECSRVPH